MKNFKVIDTNSKEVLGDFLNVETSKFSEVTIWYFCEKDQMIKSVYREDITLEEEDNFGPC